MATSTLLTLPREIRDSIYGFLCEVENGHDPSILKCNSTTHRVRSANRYNSDTAGILYPLHYPSYRLLSLIHTCNQLRGEVLDFFRRIGNSHPDLQSYKLEIIALPAMAGRPILPTWYHVLLPPPFYDQIESLDVDFRIVTYDDCYSGFQGAGGVPDVYRSLFKLFSDFIFHGPQFYYDPKISDTKRSFVKKLTISISAWTITDAGYEKVELQKKFRARFAMWIRILADAGYLGGVIGEILVYGETSVLDIPVKIRSNPGETKLKADWERYGFHWGRKISQQTKEICKCKIYSRREGTDYGLEEDFEGVVEVIDCGHLMSDGSSHNYLISVPA